MAQPSSPLTSAGAGINDLLGGAVGPPGAGQDAAQASLMDLMGRIRDLQVQVDDLGGQFPAIQPLAQQVRAILKQMVVAAANQGSAQTQSSAMVPGGGGGAPM